MANRIFISYRREESKYQARMIYQAFSKLRPTSEVFMDVDTIPLGVNFAEVIGGWVQKCDVLLALVGAGWLESKDPKTGFRRLDNPNDFVRIEVSEALNRGIPVVPVLLDDAPLPDQDQLPDDLRTLFDRNAAYVSYRTFDGDVEGLIKRLGTTDKQSPEIAQSSELGGGAPVQTRTAEDTPTAATPMVKDPKESSRHTYWSRRGMLFLLVIIPALVATAIVACLYFCGPPGTFKEMSPSPIRGSDTAPPFEKKEAPARKLRNGQNCT